MNDCCFKSMFFHAEAMNFVESVHFGDMETANEVILKGRLVYNSEQDLEEIKDIVRQILLEEWEHLRVCIDRERKEYLVSLGLISSRDVQIKAGEEGNWDYAARVAAGWNGSTLQGQCRVEIRRKIAKEEAMGEEEINGEIQKMGNVPEKIKRFLMYKG